MRSFLRPSFAAAALTAVFFAHSAVAADTSGACKDITVVSFDQAASSQNLLLKAGYPITSFDVKVSCVAVENESTTSVKKSFKSNSNAEAVLRPTADGQFTVNVSDICKPGTAKVTVPRCILQPARAD